MVAWKSIKYFRFKNTDHIVFINILRKTSTGTGTNNANIHRYFASVTNISSDKHRNKNSQKQTEQLTHNIVQRMDYQENLSMQQDWQCIVMMVVWHWQLWTVGNMQLKYKETATRKLKDKLVHPECKHRVYTAPDKQVWILDKSPNHMKALFISLGHIHHDTPVNDTACAKMS